MTGSGSGASRDDPDRHDGAGSDSNVDGDGSRAGADDPERPPGDGTGAAGDGSTPLGTDGDGRTPPTDGPGTTAGAVRNSSVSIEDDGVLRWFLRSEEGGVVYARDIVTSVGVVALIALLLFGISGVWPPLVAVESGSMEPNMERGDMIFVVADDRFVGDGNVAGTGVVTREGGAESGHSTFGESGDVIIFQPDGDERETPVIHRAYYFVEEDENWIDDRADPALTNAQSCEQVHTCPAPHDGFITRGDANGGYDQVGSGADTTVIKADWIEGKAHYRIPWLGYIRLTVDEVLLAGPGGTAVGAVAGLVGMLTAAAMVRPSGRP
ncbi:S26 family signal peptidase [Halovivax sp.]|uniref:S26 family signal peptidase n=1 Tax=Halovivax sp. TaxID=1935978 RepID=UPI0025C036F8|nr:S26 family signal peptidase [Halovivax sp.]